MHEDPLQADLSPLWAYVTKRFALGRDTVHGPDHWQRVERNGLDIARDSGADILVVRLFAALHDSKRENENHDPDHGRRAAELAATLRGRFFDVTDDQFDKLTDACFWHDRGRTSPDPTIGTCWDADRLDLPRVGIRPHAKYFSTVRGRELAGGS